MIGFQEIGKDTNEVIENLQNNEMSLKVDKEVINQKIEAPKKVTFEEPRITNTGSNNKQTSSKDMFVLKLEHKIIILSTFFLFSNIVYPLLVLT